MLSTVTALISRVTGLYVVRAMQGAGLSCILEMGPGKVLAGLTRRIDGVSQVRLDASGRVAEHVDFWDPAAGLYEDIPLLGSALRWLRRRLSADH